ncbi:MAG TPA: ribosome small subunit-dependent GTPase A [Acholeplasmatales bacterium]|nr:MAG: ribosome small subunit-dependent GTPase A [Tenericutes bacterium GWF2_57_13]HAQ56403.1 ribosome small subunit-dependent GTPase A [Acholeplasmatales bacterium]
MGGIRLKEGKIIRLTGGLYTVVDAKGTCVDLRAAGLFRHHNESPKVGDDVTLDDDLIRTIKPRRNDLVRPAIANVDQALLVNACKEPEFSFLLLDQFLLLILSASVKPVIVISKIDLLTAAELAELKRKLSYYEPFFPVVYVDSLAAFGAETMRPYLKGKTSVLAGQTGAGKSSLLNAVDPTQHRATDAISRALGRGKHTTRTVELIPFGDGWIADTPGFSSLEFAGIELATIQDLYPDFTAIANNCRFNGCTHVHEPDCAVKAAVAAGTILPERHYNYLRIREEIKSLKIRY